MIFAMYIKSAKKLQIGKKNEFLRIFATPAQGEKIKIFIFLKKIQKLEPKSTPNTYEDDQIYKVGLYWTHLMCTGPDMAPRRDEALPHQIFWTPGRGGAQPRPT